MRTKPFSPADMARLRQIVQATVEASPQRRQVRSPRRVTDLYMGLVNSLAEAHYVRDLRLIEVRYSYRKLSGLIGGGKLCARSGQPMGSIKEHTISRYVRLMVDLDLATYTESGWALKVPVIDYLSPLPQPAPRPMPAPEPTVIVRRAEPVQPPEVYPWSEQIPEFQKYLRRSGVDESAWTRLSLGEREDWMDKFMELMGSDQYRSLVESVRTETDQCSTRD